MCTCTPGIKTPRCGRSGCEMPKQPKRVKKVFKYGTGQEIPEAAVYLRTVKQTEILNERPGNWVPCWLIWHYFLVEVEE